ncbi:MAG: hypothetical protein ABI692_02230 [Terracoccus sp.]
MAAKNITTSEGELGRLGVRTRASFRPVPIAAGGRDRSLQDTGRHGCLRALADHYMSAESRLPTRLPAEGEQMATADYRDIAPPHSRPDQEGM